MSLFESGRSGGEVSLARLLSGQPMEGVRADRTIADIAEAIAVGGWPELQDLKVPEALRTMRGYVDEIARADVSKVDDRRRDPTKVSRLLASLARNVATHVAATTLAADAGGSEGALDDDTVRDGFAKPRSATSSIHRWP
jgi:predicted AAA+ superfamily ATPase